MKVSRQPHLRSFSTTISIGARLVNTISTTPPYPSLTHRHHVSRRNHPLRHRLRPRHPRSRPCLRIRTVCLLTPRPVRSSSSFASYPAPASSPHTLHPRRSPSISFEPSARCLPRYAVPLREATDLSSHPRPFRTNRVTASSNNTQGTVASFAAISPLRVQLLVDCEYPWIMYPARRQLMPAGSPSWNTRTAVMQMMRTTRCITSALVATIC